MESYKDGDIVYVIDTFGCDKCKYRPPACLDDDTKSCPKGVSRYRYSAKLLNIYDDVYKTQEEAERALEKELTSDMK